jgi:carboxyl-terminal processing protease
MHKRIKILVIVTVAISAFAFTAPTEKYFDIAKSLDIFTTLFKEVNVYYVDEIEPEKLVNSGIQGMLKSLDPYTDYIPEDKVESFRISTTGQYGGVGALIGVVNKKVVITNPYRDFPAYRAGLRVGDELISIDGVNVKGKTTTEISSLLKGEPKTDVKVEVQRPGVAQNINVQLKREKINLKNVSYSGLVDEKTGYIRLTDFTSGATKEVSDAVKQLKKQGAKSLILDLRANPGGLLHEAVNMVNIFLPRGIEVVSTKGKALEWNKSYKTLNTPVDTLMPIVVLVSETSASAAEIVAGALQDYDRAVLIGKRTFGKGLVQTTRPLSYNAQLKVTTAKYYIPSGRCIQALDYTHRLPDGTVERVADSLKHAYKTKHGRIVFDGGGLDPDIVIEPKRLSPIAQQLLSSGYVFDFASMYSGKNPIQSFKGIQLSEAEYQRFIEYINEQGFVYNSPLEASFKKLQDVAAQDSQNVELETSLKLLKDKIEMSKQNDLKNNKEEIKKLLEEQIAFHYAQDEGKALVSLPKDQAVIKARALLADNEYTKVLALSKE